MNADRDELLLGVHHDVPIEVYHGGPGISKSGLDIIARSPAHYHWSRRHPRPSTGAYDLGKVFHTAVLEPHLLDTMCVLGLEQSEGVKLPKRKDVDKERWQAFEEEHRGKCILTRQELHHVAGMARAVREHPVASLLCDPDDEGGVEVSAYWHDPGTEVLCKCRPDKVNATHDILVDLKSTLDADITSGGFLAFDRTAAKHRYHVSAAMSTEGWERVTGSRPEAYVFVVVEKDPPHCVAMYVYDRESIDKGRELMARDLDVYAQCLDRDVWPGYPADVQTLTLPRWYLND